MAELILAEGTFSSVLFIDRIASGGASDEALTNEERRLMRRLGEYQFAELYARAIEAIIEAHKLPRHFSIGGSSAGATAALACAGKLTERQKKEVLNVVIVEPSGLRRHGLGAKGFAAVPHALARHVAAYRHRISRGWWTPMDKEQYFNRNGKMFEYRATWWATDFVYDDLLRALGNVDFPPLTVVLSRNSHVHTDQTRKALVEACRKPHKVVLVTGNHDRICQPPSLSKFYAGQYQKIG